MCFTSLSPVTTTRYSRAVYRLGNCTLIAQFTDFPGVQLRTVYNFCFAEHISLSPPKFPSKQVAASASPHTVKFNSPPLPQRFHFFLAHFEISPQSLAPPPNRQILTSSRSPRPPIPPNSRAPTSRPLPSRLGFPFRPPGAALRVAFRPAKTSLGRLEACACLSSVKLLGFSVAGDALKAGALLWLRSSPRRS